MMLLSIHGNGFVEIVAAALSAILGTGDPTDAKLRKVTSTFR
jgi:hypothetical protein